MILSYAPPVKVAVLGASANPARYSHRAVQRLRTLGHEVFGVNPSLPDLGPVPVVASVRELPPGVHTLTVYVAPERCAGLEDELNAAGFARVIFNPGSENPALAARLAAGGAEVIEACTLVLLATGEFARGVAPAP